MDYILYTSCIKRKVLVNKIYVFPRISINSPGLKWAAHKGVPGWRAAFGETTNLISVFFGVTPAALNIP